MREEVRVMQYGRPDIPDVLEASGTIVCKADLAGVPDVSLMLSNTEAITHLFVHDRCVRFTAIARQLHGTRSTPKWDVM